MTSTETECGRSSGVEHNLAKVRVVSSNLIARSNREDPSGTRNRAAFGRPVFVSLPVVLGTAHHDKGGDGLHLRQDAEDFGVPVLVMRQVAGFDAQKVFHGAGNIVAIGLVAYNTH